MSNVALRVLLSAVVASTCGLVVRTGPVLAASESAHIADPDPSRFESEIDAFEAWDSKNAYPRHAVLFVGSSSIRMWPTAKAFSQFPVINRGFGGSHISDVNHFAERIVLKYQPRLIVFYAGDNDIESGKSVEQVFADFQAFVTLVHERLPETSIIFLPIKPSIARWAKWPRMQAVNSSVEALAKRDKTIIYVDTATPMLGDNGKPRRELFLSDGLHLNESGYNLWTEALMPVLKESTKY